MKNLNGLRAIAALLVLVSHAGNFNLIIRNSGNGQLGVMLFFVLSGFLMGHLYVLRKAQVFSIRDFWIKRLLRVVPLFLLVLLGSYIGQKFGLNWLFPIDDSNVINHLTLSEGVWVLWTIPVELKFYAVFPFLAIPLVSIKDEKTKFLVATVWLFFAIFLQPDGKLALITYLNFFYFGVWLSLAREVLLPALTSRYVDGIFVLWLMSFYIVSPAMGPNLGVWGTLWWHDLPFLLWAGTGVLLSTYSGALLNVTFGNRIMVWIGQISYGVYLLHYPLFRIARKLPTSDTGDFVIALGVTLLLAMAFFRLFEEPIQKWGRANLLDRVR